MKFFLLSTVLASAHAIAASTNSSTATSSSHGRAQPAFMTQMQVPSKMHEDASNGHDNNQPGMSAFLSMMMMQRHALPSTRQSYDYDIDETANDYDYYGYDKSHNGEPQRKSFSSSHSEKKGKGSVSLPNTVSRQPSSQSHKKIPGKSVSHPSKTQKTSARKSVSRQSAVSGKRGRRESSHSQKKIPKGSASHPSSPKKSLYSSIPHPSSPQKGKSPQKSDANRLISHPESPLENLFSSILQNSHSNHRPSMWDHDVKPSHKQYKRNSEQSQSAPSVLQTLLKTMLLRELLSRHSPAVPNAVIHSASNATAINRNTSSSAISIAAQKPDLSSLFKLLQMRQGKL